METGVCVNSRNTGGANVYRERFFRLNRLRNIMLVAVLALVVFAASTGTAVAVPQAPQLMPGFPMLAGNLVMVMWVPVPGSVKYHLYLDDAKVAEVIAPPYQFPTPEKGGEHKVEVVAVDAAGGVSPKSRPGVFRIVTLEAPKDLTGIYDPDKKHVRLRWVPAPGAVIYNLHRADKKGGEAKAIQSTQDARGVDADVKEGRQYFYSVTAKDLTGKESGHSEIAVVDTTAAVQAARGAGGGDAPKLVPIPAKELDQTMLPAYPGSIVVLPDGRLAVAMQFIALYDNFETKQYTRLGEKIDHVNAISLDPDGTLLVSQPFYNKVLKINPDTGEELLSFSLPEMTEEYETEGRKIPIKKSAPFDSARLPDGRYVVTDNPNSRVLILDSKGKLLKVAGRDEGKHIVPLATYVAVSRKGTIYAVAGGGNTVEIFDTDGRHKGSFGGTGNIAGTFARIQDLLVDAEDNVWVVDMVNGNIQKFSAEGKVLGVVSGEDKKSNIVVTTPASMAITKDKSLIVTESIYKRMKKFKFLEQ